MKLHSATDIAIRQALEAETLEITEHASPRFGGTYFAISDHEGLIEVHTTRAEAERRVAENIPQPPCPCEGRGVLRYAIEIPARERRKIRARFADEDGYVDPADIPGEFVHPVFCGCPIGELAEELGRQVGGGDHSSEDHCTLDARQLCIYCGAYHGEQCEHCGARGFHRLDCPESDAA